MLNIKIMALTLRVDPKTSENLESLDQALSLLKKGHFGEALKVAQSITDIDLPQISKGSLKFVLGASNNELGNSELAILNLLEGYALISRENQPAMLGHFQDELARVLHKTGNLNASLFFIEMAISNFKLDGYADMVASCQKLKDELLGLL